MLETQGLLVGFTLKHIMHTERPPPHLLPPVDKVYFVWFSKQIHLPQSRRPCSDRERSQAKFIGKPELTTLLCSRPPRHRNALWRIVLGVAARAEHG